MRENFITGRASVSQDPSGIWRTEHNQLFIDSDYTICLVPRNEETDGYSYPTGGRMAQWDIRPAIGHDFECKYHQKILVKLTPLELMQKGYIRHKIIDGERIIICRNIPAEYLEIVDVTFLQANSRFKRMMKACGISAYWFNIMFAGVHLNINWLRTGKKSFDIDNIYTRNN